MFEVKTMEQLQRWTKLFKPTEIFCTANLPLKTLDNVSLKKHLECNLTNVGMIPSLSHLRQFYLPRESENYVNAIKENLKTYDGISTVTETKDAKYRYILNILAVLSTPQCENELKLNCFCWTVWVWTLNFKIVSQEIWETLDKCASFDWIMAVMSDNTIYMKKDRERRMKSLVQNAVHAICDAHLLKIGWCGVKTLKK